MKTIVLISALLLGLANCGGRAQPAPRPARPPAVVTAAEIETAAAGAQVLVVQLSADDDAVHFLATYGSLVTNVRDNAFTLAAGTLVNSAHMPQATEEFSVNEDDVARQMAESLEEGGSGSLTLSMDAEAHDLGGGYTSQLQSAKAFQIERIVAPRGARPCTSTTFEECRWAETEDSRVKIFKPTTFEFRPGGNLVQFAHGGMFENGTWSRDGDNVYFELNEKALEFRGKIEGDRVPGSGQTRDGRTFRWSLRRASPRQEAQANPSSGQ